MDYLGLSELKVGDGLFPSFHVPGMSLGCAKLAQRPNTGSVISTDLMPKKHISGIKWHFW
jgi:hypothetical protein